MIIKRNYVIIALVVVLMVLGIAIFTVTGRSGTLALTAADNLPANTEVKVNILPIDGGKQSVTLKKGFTEGKEVQIRLCAIPGLPSTSQESRPGDKYYVKGANGLAMVNSNVSANFFALVNAAKAAGKEISATSSFRTDQHQRDLCSADPHGCPDNTTYVARPGYSNHQLGLAVDFKFTTRNNTPSNCVNKGGVCTAVGDPLYDWLVLPEAAAKEAIAQYPAEFWHWEPAALRN